MLKQFIDVDYSQEKRAFIRDELIELYGRVLVEIATWSHLGEMILEKSFFSNTGSDIELVDYEIESSASSINASSSQPETESARKKRTHAVNECRDQQSLLALIKYILKTVDLVYILRRLSINKIHFRFLIVNFSLSPQASKVWEIENFNHFAFIIMTP